VQETERAETACFDCHTNRDALQVGLDQLAPDRLMTPPMQPGGLAVMYAEPANAGHTRSRLEQVLVDNERYPQTVHGHMACTSCHGGVDSADIRIAHTGILRRPGVDYEHTCGYCHQNITSVYANSLHATTAGMTTAIHARAHSSDRVRLTGILEEICVGCAASCGDCHVGVPLSAGGGLLDGHNFAPPDMTVQCMGCHGATSAGEYLGVHTGLADVHYAQGGMDCSDCHRSDRMHGQAADCQSCHVGPQVSSPPPPSHRYAETQSPSCESCHVSASTGADGLIWHTAHGADLACQTCHAEAYTNCADCHLGLDGTVSLGEMQTGLVIGRNPLRSFARPYHYITLRQVPTTPDTFSSYGQGLLGRFDRIETWRYATPHTIQRHTSQTATCFACHGNAEFFLTADRLITPWEMAANQRVVVPVIPSVEQVINAGE
jgi:thiosulfate/3-mercaptopyruvate sulfurtransferase